MYWYIYMIYVCTVYICSLSQLAYCTCISYVSVFMYLYHVYICISIYVLYMYISCISIYVLYMYIYVAFLHLYTVLCIRDMYM